MTHLKKRQNKEIHFLLPGFSRTPSGGYKIVYEYANYLAKNIENRVTIHHTKGFFNEPGLPNLTWVRLRSIKAWGIGLAMHRRHRPVPWFPLHKNITVRNRVGLPRIKYVENTVLVATSVQTASFVARFIKTHERAAGVYFLQSYEDWAASASFVESTWKLPLHRVVIAPWLQDIGNALQVKTHVVPNAIDPVKFPRGPLLSSRPKRIVGLVSVLPLKRTDLLIAVYKELRASDPDTDFVTFGTCRRPEELPDWVQYYESPTPEKLIDIYQSARIYICVSDMEGFGLPPAEALLCGAAVVSTDIGGVRAYATDSALFSPPGETLGLVRNVRYLFENPDFAQIRADSGYEELIKSTPQSTGRRFEEELDQALRLRKNKKNETIQEDACESNI